MIARGARSGKTLTECVCMDNSLETGLTYLKRDKGGRYHLMRWYLRTLINRRLVSGDGVW